MWIIRLTSLNNDVSETEEDILEVTFKIHGIGVFSDENVPSGQTASIDLYGLIEYDTSYNWYVDVVDSSGLSVGSEEFTFTTMKKPVGPVNDPPNKPAIPAPDDDATDVSISPTLSVFVSDPDNALLNVSFYNAFDDSLIGIDRDVFNNSRSSVVWSDLIYSSFYEWYAVVDDGEFTVPSEIFSFTTRDEPNSIPPDEPLYPEPGNDATDVSISSSLSVFVSDPDTDLLKVTFYDASRSDDNIISIDEDVNSDSRSSVIWSGLEFTSVYQWYAVVDDGESSISSEIFSFTTTDKPNENEIILIKPDEKTYYHRNEEKRRSLCSIIIGGIDIEADVICRDTDLVKKVAFLIDDKVIHETDYTPSEDHYIYNWNERAIGLYIIGVALLDESGEKIVSDDILSIVINFGIFKD